MPIGLSPDLISLGTAEEPHLGRLVSSEVDMADVAILGLGPEASEVRRSLYTQSFGLMGELASLQIADLGDPADTAAIAAAARHGPPLVLLGDSRDAGLEAIFGARPGRGAVVAVDPRLTGVKRLYDRWGNRLASFVAVGTQPQHGWKAHADFLRTHSGRVATLDELRTPPGVIERMKRELGATAGTGDFAAVMLDLRSRASDADGLTAEELMRFCEHCGRHPKVQLLELIDPRPAQLAALCVWRFLVGITAR